MNEFIKSIQEPSSNSLFWKLWEATSFEMVLKFFILYICIIWIATIVWVVKDITNRSASIIAQLLCILLVVGLPFIGIFLYLLVRPSNTLLEKYYSEIEENLNTMAEFIHQHIESQKNTDNWVLTWAPGEAKKHKIQKKK